MRYGLKEVADVTFYNVISGAPEIFFDTLKVSTIENESESAEATGGHGGGTLVEWDYNRTAVLNIQDALLSDATLSALAGDKAQTENIVIHKRESLVVQGGNVELTEMPLNEDKVFVWTSSQGVLVAPISTFTLEDGVISITSNEVADGDTVMVFYEHSATDEAMKVTFSANKFPSVYKVVGDTFVRDRNGTDRAVQFVIPQAKLQTTFSLTMDVENVSTFDFNLNAMKDPETDELYSYIRQ